VKIARPSDSDDYSEQVASSYEFMISLSHDIQGRDSNQINIDTPLFGVTNLEMG
jgi:hypothetical protein